MIKFQQIRNKEIIEAVDPSDTGGKEEANMAMKQIKAMRHFLDGIEARVKSTGDMEEWYQNKLTKANESLKTLYSYGKGDKTESVDEGYKSAAQRKAVWAARNDAKNEDSDAVKAFLAKGGKIKKLPPAKAQGYHGKDDPGQDVKGIMNKDDSKAIGTRKKVKSMEAKVNELSPATKKSYINKAASDIDNRSYAQGTVDATNTKYDGKNNRKIANRLKGISRATKEENIKELTHDTMNKYYDKAKKSKDKATNSAVATIMRKGDHSQDLKTMSKREKGMKLAKTRSIKKIRGDK